jgi:hypothetical protein
MTERSADRAAVANGPVGDGTGDPLHGAARHVGYSPIFDVTMGDARADDEFIAAAFRLLQFGKS